MSLNYRREIDGLRAIAVVPVVLFHAGFPALEGGFLGVDVFFVISGYLITGILLDELQADRFSLAGFYERRARRILPALFLVVFCSCVAAWFWMVPLEFREFGKSVVAVMLFVSNIYFWTQIDYFAAPAGQQPLLHTWSLAVEEQFYVVFPLLLWGLWQFGRRRAFWAIVGLAVVSLAFSEWYSRVDQSANFFLAPGRAWQLLAGSICAFILNKREVASGNWLSMLGLGMILAAMALFDEDTRIPSLNALLPVCGAVLVILFASGKTWVGRGLSSRPFVGLGLISYSTYLWHQPLFAFARIRLLHPPGAVMTLGLIASSFLLAYLTWRFVEKPFRKSASSLIQTRSAVFGASLAGGLALLLIGAFGDNARFYALTHSPYQVRMAGFVFDDVSPRQIEAYRRGKCFIDSRWTFDHDYDQGLCLKRSPDRPNVLLIGDSHAAHLWYGLSQVFPNINVMQATASGCRPFRPLKGDADCVALQKFVMDVDLPAHPVDEIILAGRWTSADLPRFAETIAYLRHYATRVTVVGPTIEYMAPLSIILGRTEDAGKAPDLATSYLVTSRFDLAAQLRPIVEAAGGRYVDLAGSVCPNGKCRLFAPNGAPISWDYGHFTADGSVAVVRGLLETGALTLEDLAAAPDPFQ